MSNKDEFPCTSFTDAPSKVIQAINQETVHKICSGQVSTYNFSRILTYFFTTFTNSFI